jgi:hypothetical protein
MIRPLRGAHFWIWLVLAAAMYAVFVAGLVARRTSNPMNSNLHQEQYR